MEFRNFIKKWLGYTRRERTGSMVLLAILLVVLLLRLRGYRRQGHEVDVTQDVIASYEQAYNNRAGTSDNMQQDLPGRVITGITGERRSKVPGREDSLSAGNEQILSKSQGKDFLYQPQQRKSDPGHMPESYPQTQDVPGRLIDLNNADSAQLEALPGIGPVLAVRIIKYCYLVGFFHSIDQLYDVYGLGADVIELNRHLFTCDTGLLRKIYINSASYHDLLRHPYISREQVGAILSHRELSGPVTGVEDLIRNRIFTGEELKKLGPYLDFR